MVYLIFLKMNNLSVPRNTMNRSSFEDESESFF